MTNKEFPIVTLCGSTRFVEHFDQTSMKFSLEGWIVLSVGSHRYSDENFEITSEQFKMLAKMHQRKIDMSDLVYIINKNGYIGSGTRDEIEYAKSKGKEIKYLETI